MHSFRCFRRKTWAYPPRHRWVSWLLRHLASALPSNSAMKTALRHQPTPSPSLALTTLLFTMTSSVSRKKLLWPKRSSGHPSGGHSPCSIKLPPTQGYVYYNGCAFVSRERMSHISHVYHFYRRTIFAMILPWISPLLPVAYSSTMKIPDRVLSPL